MGAIESYLKFVTQCPACQETLVAARLTCPACDLHLEGQFELPPLLGLPPADLDFIVRFVRASGSLKEMAKLEGQSYPTIRARLDDLIARLDAAYRGAERTQHEILDAIADGRMTAAEADALLAAMRGGSRVSLRVLVEMFPRIGLPIAVAVGIAAAGWPGRSCSRRSPRRSSRRSRSGEWGSSRDRGGGRGSKKRASVEGSLI
jgi:hypothetical protein